MRKKHHSNCCENTCFHVSKWIFCRQDHSQLMLLIQSLIFQSLSPMENKLRPGLYRNGLERPTHVSSSRSLEKAFIWAHNVIVSHLDFKDGNNQAEVCFEAVKKWLLLFQKDVFFQFERWQIWVSVPLTFSLIHLTRYQAAAAVLVVVVTLLPTLHSRTWRCRCCWCSSGRPLSRCTYLFANACTIRIDPFVDSDKI